MYTEEYDKRPFPFRDFLLKFIIIVIFVLLLIWLIPKFTEPKKSKSETTDSQVFTNNLNKMKDAAIKYYNKKDRMPDANNKEVLTLRQMITKNMLSAFTDKDGKACNVEKSYIQVTSENEEYVLKVNLSCSDEEDYLLTKLGSYSYCESEICEKDLTKTDENETQVEEETGTTDEDDHSVGESDTSNEEVLDSPSASPSIVYEYKKETAAFLTVWTDWGKKTRNSSRLQAVTCGINDTNCLLERKLIQEKEEIGKTASGQTLVATVTYYQERTRTLVPATSDTKYSSSNNDQTLINSGYIFTGNTREQ